MYIVIVAMSTGIVLGAGLLVPVRRRAGYYRYTGAAVMAVATAFVGTFFVGETLADPGGRSAAVMVVLWLVPLAGLVAAAWLWPGRAVTAVLAALALVVCALDLWYLADRAGLRDFEDGHGPVRMLAGFAVAAALVVLGLRRPGAAGLLLLGLGGVPMALELVATGGREAVMSGTIVGLPCLAAGACQALAAVRWPAAR